MSDRIPTALIPAAGLGTRLLSATKEQPKEMLPIFSADEDNILCVKPLVQQIFEQLYDHGIRNFYFVVGKGKRAIEDHFTPDREYIHRLNSHGKNVQAFQLESFYRRIQASMIVWVNQPEPKGFGHAVLQAKRLISTEPFLVHAGDTLIKSRTETILARLAKAYMKTQADAMLTLQEVEDPRQYGVAEVNEASDGNLDIEMVVEKPTQPKSKLAIMPLYVLNQSIFSALETTPLDKGGEIQLTDAIQKLIDTGHRVQAIKLREDDMRLDIGTPETYWEALELSYRYASSKGPLNHR
jgi:UTP--glucose-1-phosphate uridylyltransferase